jgi:hypothetical protein
MVEEKIFYGESKLITAFGNIDHNLSIYGSGKMSGRQVLEPVLVN